MPKKKSKKANPKGKPKRKASGRELSEEQLERVAGGAGDVFAKIGDIKGESLDSKHKDEIELIATDPFKPRLKRS
jgi:flagellar hook-length control protein FliK